MDMLQEVAQSLDLEEVAEHLGVSYQTIFRRVQDGSIKAWRMGRKWMVRPEDLRAYLARCYQESTNVASVR
mgnify:CR=1 FL=1